MMGTIASNREMLCAEFLDLLHQRAEERFSGKLEQAFVDWYVEAEFGDVEWDFTDGAHDGGIDALVWLKHEKLPVVVIQSKFSCNIGSYNLAQNAYEKFSEVVDLFYCRNDADFESWLDKVHESLRAKYRKAYESLGQLNWANGKKAFRLATCSRRVAAREHGRLPSSDYRYEPEVLELYRHYRVVGMPKPKPLSLSASQVIRRLSHGGQVESLLFNARMSEFKSYLNEVDVARVVARNIRFNLGKRIGAVSGTPMRNHPRISGICTMGSPWCAIR